VNWIYPAGPKKLGTYPGTLPRDFLTEVLDCALDIRIADFKECVLLPLLLLLFEKPSAAGEEPGGP
jgi:hypothetical protein